MSAISLEKLSQVRRVIAHGGRCPDGRASAMIVNNAFLNENQTVQIDFIAHGTKEHAELEPEPGMLFVDFSVHPDRVDDFLAAGALVLDHHRGPEQADGTYLNKVIVQRFVDAGLGAFGDEEENPGVCGAVLAFEHVWKPLYLKQHPKYDPTDILDEYELDTHNYIGLVKNFATLAGVRDTWQRSHPDWIRACEQGEALGFWPEETLLDAAPSEWNSLLKIGAIIWERKQNTIQKVSEKIYHWTSKKGTRVGIFQGTKLSSDIAETLGARVDLVIGFDIGYDNEKIKLLLSTRSHSDFNCAQFCWALGGGGHTKAAGCNAEIFVEETPNPYKQIMDLLNAYECPSTEN